jgi:hypothetical protein
MIDTIATRRFTLGEREYQKGDTVQMPLQQFQALEPTGLVTRPAAEKSAPKPKTAKTKGSKPAAEPIAADTEPKSSDTAD